MSGTIRGWRGGLEDGFGGAVWPHLTSTEIELLVGLRALWKAPEWGFKVLALAYAIRRFRRSGPRRIAT